MKATFLDRAPQIPGRVLRPGAHFGWRAAVSTTLTALLVACGGGGDSGGGTQSVTDEVVGPPTASASLSNTTAEAQQSAPAIVAAADAAASRVESLSGLSAVFGGSVVPQGLLDDGRRQILATGQVLPASVQSVGCTDFFDPPCAGSITMDTNVADTATAVKPGDYADIQFGSASGSLFGQSVALNGRLRIDFLSAFDFNATQFNGLDLKLKLEAFGGSLNGAGFGPVSDTARLQIDTQARVTIVAGGASYTGLHGVTISGSGSYSIAGGTVRLAYWSDSGKYIDITLQNWRVVGGRPAVGSQATIATGQGSATLSVSSSSTSTVVYAVAITAGGGNTHYAVTATYPAGGGAPTYVAVGVP